jgi:hypothetical protein
MKSWHDASLCYFCSSLSLCGTNFEQILTFPKCSWTLWQIVSLLMFNSSAINLRAYRPSGITISRTFATMYAFRRVEGRPLLGSSWKFSHPSSNRLNRSDTLLQLKGSSPQRVCDISLAFYPVRNKIVCSFVASRPKKWQQLKTRLTELLFMKCQWLDLLIPANCW